MRSLTKYICTFCGAEFWRAPCYVNRTIRNGRRLACSKGCSNRVDKKQAVGDKNPAWRGGVTKQQKICPQCNKEFYGRSSRLFCSRSCCGAYGLPTSPAINTRNPAKYRELAESILGRPLTMDEVVHHIDGDYRNNTADNLAVMTKSKHTRLHMIEKANKITELREKQQ